MTQVIGRPTDCKQYLGGLSRTPSYSRMVEPHSLQSLLPSCLPARCGLPVRSDRCGNDQLIAKYGGRGTMEAFPVHFDLLRDQIRTQIRTQRKSKCSENYVLNVLPTSPPTPSLAPSSSSCCCCSPSPSPSVVGRRLIAPMAGEFERKVAISLVLGLGDGNRPLSPNSSLGSGPSTSVSISVASATASASAST